MRDASDAVENGEAMLEAAGTSVAGLTRVLRRLAMSVGAQTALLLRLHPDHRFVTTLAISGPANRFEARRLARSATVTLLAAPMMSPPPPIAMSIDGAPALLQRLAGGTDLAMVLVRTPGDPDFTDEQRATLGNLIAWIEDIVDMWWQNERGAARVAGLRAALGKSDVAAILLDCNGHIVDSNRAADRFLNGGHGIARNGAGITATNPDDAAALTLAIRGVILHDSTAGKAHATQNLQLHRDGGQRPLMAAVLRPFDGPRMQLSADDPAVLVLIADPQSSTTTSVAEVCALYGLTAGETRLADALCAGMTVAEAASALHLQRESARTYVRRIFAKTGVARQSDLIRLLMSSRIPAGPRRVARPVKTAIPGIGDILGH